MYKALGIAALVVGVILLVYGIIAADSLSSDISNFFSGTPTDRSMWLIIGGIAGIIVGLVLMATARRAR